MNESPQDIEFVRNRKVVSAILAECRKHLEVQEAASRKLNPVALITFAGMAAFRLFFVSAPLSAAEAVPDGIIFFFALFVIFAPSIYLARVKRQLQRAEKEIADGGLKIVQGKAASSNRQTVAIRHVADLLGQIFPRRINEQIYIPYVDEIFEDYIKARRRYRGSRARRWLLFCSTAKLIVLLFACLRETTRNFLARTLKTAFGVAVAEYLRHLISTPPTRGAGQWEKKLGWSGVCRAKEVAWPAEASPTPKRQWCPRAVRSCP